jgi:hypothetical protein
MLRQEVPFHNALISANYFGGSLFPTNHHRPYSYPDEQSHQRILVAQAERIQCHPQAPPNTFHKV